MKTRHRWIHQTILIGFLVLCACEESQLKAGLSGGAGNEAQSCSAPLSLSYDTVAPIFAQRCQRCHGEGTRLSVATYDDVFRLRDAIRLQVESGSMPIGAPLPSGQKELLLAWLSAGAPAQSDQVLECGSKEGDAVETPPIPNRPLSYAGLRASFLDAKCMVCHRSGGSASLYDFSTYESLLDLSLFDVREPEKSEIVKIVRIQGRGRMPPTRSGIEPLTDQETEFLIEWIRAGLPK